MLPMNLISDSKEMTARCSKNAFHAELQYRITFRLKRAEALFTFGSPSCFFCGGSFSCFFIQRDNDYNINEIQVLF